MNKINLKQLKFKTRFEYLRSIVFEEKALQQKGAVFEVVKFPPNVQNKKHSHKRTTEIFFIKKGKGIIMIDGKKYPVQENDILLIPQECIHQVMNKSKKDLIILIFKTNSAEDDLYFSKN